MQGRGSLAKSTVSLGSQSCRQPTGFGQETRTIPPYGGVFLGTGAPQPLSPPAPPSRVVRKEEEDEWLLDVKGAVHDCHFLMHLQEERNGCELCRETNHPAASTQGWAVNLSVSKRVMV